MTTSLLRSLALALLSATALFSLGSCVPLAAGAAAGYVAHEEGYRVQSPVTRR